MILEWFLIRFPSTSKTKSSLNKQEIDIYVQFGEKICELIFGQPRLCFTIDYVAILSNFVRKVNISQFFVLEDRILFKNENQRSKVSEKIPF